MRLYLAGPDIFRPDAVEWAATARRLCHEHGHEALIPLDGTADTAAGIYAQNIAMIRDADAILANLNPFRGVEPDSGTCFETGFALALGKQVVAYIENNHPVAARVAQWQSAPLTGAQRNLLDRNGWQVEDFGLPLNLMLAVPTRIVTGGLREALATL